ncbi:MAG: DUF4249 domain-containing protein, partial [Bacteroidota bacterium]|nr:DUF4249 domain-containing protein [Bacteroidota bacterium]
PDSLIKINLSKSIGALESDRDVQFINKAVVKLYQDNNYIEDLVINESGNYLSTIYPNIDKEYKITVDVDKMKFVESYTNVPDKQNIFDIEAHVDSIVINDGFGEYVEQETTIDISFNDPPNETNYYILSFTRLFPELRYSETTTSYDTIGYSYRAIEFESNSKVLETDYMYEAYFPGYTFSDKLFDGKKCSIHSELYYYYDYNDDEVGYWLYVNLHSIDKDYYKYLVSYNDYIESNENPMAEPVIVYGNINNGIGLFSSYNTYTDSVYIE